MNDLKYLYIDSYCIPSNHRIMGSILLKKKRQQLALLASWLKFKTKLCKSGFSDVRPERVSCSGPLFYSCYVCLNTLLGYCLLHCHMELFFFAYIKGDYNNKVIIVYDKIEDNFTKICIMNKFQIKLQP